jgi:predicted phosphate transport protein (TIGR00153 family)
MENKNSFLSRLTPRETKFYPLLRDLASISVASATKLVESLASEHGFDDDILSQFKDLEHEGDKLTVQIFDELNKTFITPFDREDINGLTNNLDDVTDEIYSCAKKIHLYQPKMIPEAATQLAKMIEEATQYILLAVEELDVLKKDSKKVKAYCAKLHDIESDADETYQRFIGNLFSGEVVKDTLEVIKLKDIMNELERTTDETDHVGKIIKTIIVKYA